MLTNTYVYTTCVPIVSACAPALSGGTLPASGNLRVIVPAVVGGGALAMATMAWALWRMRGRLFRYNAS